MKQAKLPITGEFLQRILMMPKSWKIVSFEFDEEEFPEGIILVIEGKNLPTKQEGDFFYMGLRIHADEENKPSSASFFDVVCPPPDQK